MAIFSRVPKLTSALLLVLAIVFIYMNTMSHSFHFDDFHSIVENPSVREIGNIPEYFKDPGMFSGKAGIRMYRPLLLVTYAINYWFGGYDVTGYHLVNILLHVLNTLFVYLVALYLFSTSGFKPHNTQHTPYNSLWPAFITALFFGVHTINTHTVNYISSRSVLLVSFLSRGFLFLYKILCPEGIRRQSNKNLVANLLFSSLWLLSFIPSILQLFSFFKGDSSNLSHSNNSL